MGRPERRRLRPGIALALAVSALLLVADESPGRSAPPDKTYRYVVSGRQHSGDLEDFARHVAETLADGRGWNMGGSLDFERVPSGGDFTVWLAADAAVPSFGSPCTRYYSCRVGRNVVINESRWQGATPVWVSAGGSLRDYRHMVTNHEVGHWLGLGHASCGGGSQPAPVMQQQSKGLNGCRANPWPLDWERQAAARRHGVSIRADAPARDSFQSLGSHPRGEGYWILRGDGSLFGYGAVPYAGSAHGQAPELAHTVAPTRTGDGYWIATSDGSVFGFGDAAGRYFGSPGEAGAGSGLVDLAPSPSDSGYWTLRRDGSVFGFGDARYVGSPRDVGFTGESVALVPTLTGAGYWIIGADGSLFGFGDAAHRYFGSPRDQGVRSGVVAMDRTASGEGYLVATSDGSVFGYGDGSYFGSMHGQLRHPLTDLEVASEGGYRLLGADGAVFTFGPAPYMGSAS